MASSARKDPERDDGYNIVKWLLRFDKKAGKYEEIPIRFRGRFLDEDGVKRMKFELLSRSTSVDASSVFITKYDLGFKEGDLILNSKDVLPNDAISPSLGIPWSDFSRVVDTEEKVQSPKGSGKSLNTYRLVRNNNIIFALALS